MSPLWNKIKRDLWKNRGRTILVVLAIAVGVVAFGGVFTSKQVLLQNMADQFKASNPTSITITIPGGFGDELVRWVQTQPHVTGAKGNAIQLVRLYTANGSRNVQLIAADHTINNVNQIYPETGKWPPQRREIVFERSSLPITGHPVSDLIEIELENGDKRTLEIVGTIHDYQAIPANLFPQLTAYTNFSTFSWLGFPDSYTRLQVVADNSITTKEEAAAVAQDIKSKLEAKGYTSVTISAEKPNKHWGEDPTNAFVTILSIVGSFSLVLSIFLVINTMTALLANEKKQIGIMKAIGGTSRTLILLYFSVTLAYGMLALLVAIPLGAIVGYGNLSAVTNFLNLNVGHYQIPLPILGLEAAASLLVPLFAAAIPVFTGLRITAREAIYDSGSTAKTNPIIDRLTRSLTILSRPTLLSIRNTFRKKMRLILTLVTLTIAGSLYLGVMNVQMAMLKELDDMLSLNNYDVELFFGQSYSSNATIRTAMKTEGVVRAETPKYAIGKRIKDGAEESQSTEILGIDPNTEFMVPRMISGRWLTKTDTKEVVISNKMVRDDKTLGPGQTIEMNINDQKYQFTIAGVFMMPDQPILVVNEKFLGQISPNSDDVNSVRIATSEHGSAYIASMAKQLEQNMKKAGFNVAYSLTIDTIRSSSIGQFNFMIGFLLFMAAMVAIVGGLSLAGTMSLNVLERTREIGVMRSIGASNHSIRSMVIIESVIVGIISWLLAIPISVPLGFGFSYAIGQAFFEKPLSFIFPVSGCFIWLSIIVIISALASLAPANRASKLTIRETLAYE